MADTHPTATAKKAVLLTRQQVIDAIRALDDYDGGVLTEVMDLQRALARSYGLDLQEVLA